MSIWTPLKQIRDFFISLFRQKAPALADIIRRIGSDEVQKIWPLIQKEGAAIVDGKITLDQAVINIAKEARDVAIKDIRDALGIQSRYVKGVSQ